MDKRKEIKLRYKETLTTMGVYQVKNKINGKVLIGSAYHVEGLLNRHRFELQMGCHRNRELQMDWNQYGEEAFTFEMLEEVNPREEIDYSAYTDDLKRLEEKWFQQLQPFMYEGYNMWKRRA